MNTLRVVLAGLMLMGSACAAQKMTITAPLGGETYFEGGTEVVLAKASAKTVQVDLSRDGGTTFTHIGTINNQSKDRSLRYKLFWNVVGPASNKCLWRFTWAQGRKTIVTTSPEFSILTKDAVTGPAGLQGPKGDKGDKGDQGDIGSTGPEGSQGNKGDTGPAGPKGNTGSQGAQGATGNAGVAGPKGDTGAKGNTGATGATGPAPDINVVVNTLIHNKDFLKALVDALKDCDEFKQTCRDCCK